MSHFVLLLRSLAQAAGIVLASLSMASCKSRNLDKVAVARAAADAVPLKRDPSIVRGTLDNGRTYLLQPGATTGGGLALMLAVRVGSLNEAEDERGART